MLTNERVHQVFMACLFSDNEDTSGLVKAEGITCTVGFHPGRLASYSAEIGEMLGELSDDFQESGGGGMSFLAACNDKNGNQWTGLHRTMEQLFQLGIAAGRVMCLVPRSMWTAMPGGMPYYVVRSVPS